MTRKLFEDYFSGVIDYSGFKKEIVYINEQGYIPKSSLEIEVQMDVTDYEWDVYPTEEEFKKNLKESYERNKRWLS